MRLARTLLTGIGAGAGLMYWLDPDRGRLRRALTRDKAVHVVRRERAVTDKGLRDLEHRVEGLAYRFKNALRSEERVPDEILIERVRATLGRYTSHPSAIDVRVVEGCANISGPILA